MILALFLVKVKLLPAKLHMVVPEAAAPPIVVSPPIIRLLVVAPVATMMLAVTA